MLADRMLRDEWGSTMVAIQLGQAPSGTAANPGTTGAAIVARLPPPCALDTIQVSLGGGHRFLMPQIFAADTLRKQIIGADLALSAPEFGVLVLRNFIPAASGRAPPSLVLADGTALSAFQVLAWPDVVLAGTAECATPAQSETQSDAAVAPPPTTATLLAQVAPAAAAPQAGPPPEAESVAVRTGRGAPQDFAPSRAREVVDDANPSFNPVPPFGRVERTAGDNDDRGLLRSVVDLVETLNAGSERATVSISTVDKLVFSPVGATFDAGLINALDGTSVYAGGLAHLVGPPNLANVTVVPDPTLSVRLEADGANFRNIVGVYKFDGTGQITDVDILWLNASLDPRAEAPTLLPDLLGKIGDRVATHEVPPDTRLGYFLIANGGGGAAGETNLALLRDLFTRINVDPRTNDWRENIDLINQHLRFDGESGRVAIETAPGVLAPLAGSAYFSHDPRLNTDFRTDLSLIEASHTISGQAGGRFWIGFEDLPFTGAVSRDEDGNLRSISGNDLDYNDIVLSAVIDYPPVAVPTVWQPLGSLGARFDAVSDFITSVDVVVSGLGPDGVALLAGGLGPGVALVARSTDAFGNGHYALTLPGPVASTSAVVDELGHLLIGVSGDPSLSGRSAVSVTFNLTDIYGTTAAATASLTFPETPAGPPSQPEPSDLAAPPAPILPPLEPLATS